MREQMLVYLDVILVFSKTGQEHLVHVRRALQTLREHKLSAKLSKCEFAETELTCLGHVVTSQGLKVDLKKVQVSQDCPQPTSAHEVRQVLGLANYVGALYKDLQSSILHCLPLPERAKFTSVLMPASRHSRT